MLNKESLKSLYYKNYCPVCLTPLNKGEHEICRIFSATDPNKNRSTLSIKRLSDHNTNFKNILTLGLYGLFIPWELNHDELEGWFNKIEAILLYCENNYVPDYTVENSIKKIQNVFFSLKRLNEYTQYDFKEKFYHWRI